MASQQAIQERVQALVAELVAEDQDGELRTIDDIENAMVRIGDMVAREFGLQTLARHTSDPPEHPACPDCGHAGEHVGPHTRELITRRGEVPVTEAKYRCPKCRRHFFPSDRGAGA